MFYCRDRLPNSINRYGTDVLGSVCLGDYHIISCTCGTWIKHPYRALEKSVSDQSERPQIILATLNNRIASLPYPNHPQQYNDTHHHTDDCVMSSASSADGGCRRCYCCRCCCKRSERRMPTAQRHHYHCNWLSISLPTTSTVPSSAPRCRLYQLPPLPRPPPLPQSTECAIRFSVLRLSCWPCEWLCGALLMCVRIFILGTLSHKNTHRYTGFS